MTTLRLEARTTVDRSLTLPALVPRWSNMTDRNVIMLTDPASPIADRYRRLRLRLEQGTAEFPFRPQMTVITSAVPGEGKTTTAANLALAYAEDRTCRTLLVDADLRRPSLSGYITPRPVSGLSEVLAGKIPLDRALIELTDAGLWVLPAGAPTRNPLGLLQSPNLVRFLDELRGRFDRIVIDTPPTVPFTDAAVVASHADGTLLLVRAGKTTKPLIRRARESLVGASILGVVLNDVAFTFVDRYYYRYDEFQPGGPAYARQNGQPV